MNRARFVALAAGAAAARPGAAVAAVAGPAYGRTYAPAALRDDLAWICATLDAVAVEPYRYSDRVAFGLARDAVRALLVRPLDRSGFWIAVAPLLASLSDETIAAPYDDLVRERTPVFAPALRFDDGGVWIANSGGGCARPGDELLGVEGLPAAALEAALVSRVSAGTLARRRRLAAGAAAPFLQAIFPRAASYDVVTRAGGGRPRACSVRGVSGERRHARVAPYDYARVHDLAVLTVRGGGTDAMAGFADFLARSLTAVRADPPRGLALDLRAFSAGSLGDAAALLGALGVEPQFLYRSLRTRVSSPLRAALRPDELRARLGDVPAFRDGVVDAPSAGTRFADVPRGGRFSGRVYVLIGAGTAGVGTTCAAALSDAAAALTVGEPTGSPVDGNATPVAFATPTVGLSVHLPVQYLDGASVRPRGAAVVPDIPVAATLADAVAGRDAAIERVLADVG